VLSRTKGLYSLKSRGVPLFGFGVGGLGPGSLPFYVATTTITTIAAINATASTDKNIHFFFLLPFCDFGLLSRAEVYL